MSKRSSTRSRADAERGRQGEFADEDVSGLQAALRLAQEMGAGLGQRDLLLGRVPEEAIGSPVAANASGTGPNHPRAAQASHNHPPISSAPPIGVTTPTSRGAPIASA